MNEVFTTVQRIKIKKMLFTDLISLVKVSAFISKESGVSRRKTMVEIKRLYSDKLQKRIDNLNIKRAKEMREKRALDRNMTFLDLIEFHKQKQLSKKWV